MCKATRVGSESREQAGDLLIKGLKYQGKEI